MQTVDIAIIGSGVASTSTLIEVFRKLVAGESGQKISVTIIEKNDEFFLGVPYGSRSSVNALTITSIAGFFTDEKESAAFFDWFKAHKDELIEFYLLKGGLSAQQWLERNSNAIKNEDWKNVYFPRFFFGRYYKSIYNSLLKIVEEKQLAKVNLINAEAINILPVANGYEVTLEHADKSLSTVTATKVVVATGSAPVKEVKHTCDKDELLIINNLYEPGAEQNIKNLALALASVQNPAERNVLVIGSNASSIELLYLLAGLPDVTNLINKLVMVSKSGALPYHIAKLEYDHYPCEHLDKLKARGTYTIEELVEAAMHDIKPAVKDGVIVPYIDRIIGYTIELMQPLDEEAKKTFIGIYGMQLSNRFRRSGTDYKWGEGLLLEIGKLMMLKGAFVSMEPSGNGAGVLNYIDPETSAEKKYAEPFKVVINCTGADDLDKSAGRLIYNLVHNKLAQVNLSGKGFVVNEKFEAAPNLYIMGPLLGGNRNKRIYFWHLENASRLLYLAPYLADCLLGD